jgi:hypothetical protein
MHGLNTKPQHIVLSCRIYPSLLEQLVNNAYDMVRQQILFSYAFWQGVTVTLAM